MNRKQMDRFGLEMIVGTISSKETVVVPEVILGVFFMVCFFLILVLFWVSYMLIETGIEFKYPTMSFFSKTKELWKMRKELWKTGADECKKESKEFAELVKPALKIAWCILLTISLAIPFFDGSMQKSLIVFANITFWCVAQNIAVVLVVAGTCYILFQFKPLFRKSLFSLFSSKHGGENINVSPMKIKYFGLAFAILFALNLPKLAMIEETWFRAGTSNWLEGLNNSFLFGMVHCLVGVPLGAGMAITFAGIWFTFQYFIGGVDLSTLHHTTYNLIVTSILFFHLIRGHIIELLPKKELRNNHVEETA